MKKGFTLAEVLITLGIIGIISALTIPAVLKNYRYHVYSVSIKKAYAQIIDATQSIMNDEMTSNFAATKASMRDSCLVGEELGACYFLGKYFKVRHKCSGGMRTKCVADAYKSTSGANAGIIRADRCIQTTNGFTICHALNPANSQITLFIDTNGRAEPNMTGVDAFIMNINKDNGYLSDWSDDPADCNVRSSEYGTIADYATGCLTKVIKNNWNIIPEN